MSYTRRQEIRRAVVAMATRHATSRIQQTRAQAGSAEHLKWCRAADRQFAAIQRLTAALAA